MYPVGRLPVCFKIGDKQHLDDLHIYPNVTGTLMSWKTCKKLRILPDCYPNPTVTSTTVNSVANTIATPQDTCLHLDKHSVVREFPTVFDGKINSMEGASTLLMTQNPSALTPPDLFHTLTVINLKPNLTSYNHKTLLPLLLKPQTGVPLLSWHPRRIAIAYACVLISHT